MEQATDHKNLIYLVTSAAGLMGSQVCRQLLERGDKVRAFVLRDDPAAKYVPEGCEIAEGDVSDKDSMKDFFSLPEGMEAIVLHMAAITSMNPDYDQKVMDVNVGGTKNIIDLCLSTPGVKLVLPIPVAGVLGHVMEAVGKMTGKEPLMTSFNIYNLARNNNFDSAKAREELGYETRPYEETIRDMIQWLLDQGIIQKE